MIKAENVYAMIDPKLMQTLKEQAERKLTTTLEKRKSLTIKKPLE